MLIAAYLAEEHDGGRARTVREFVAEFDGLTRSAKQKEVTTAADLLRAYLHDLVDSGDVNHAAVERLLAAMQAESRPVRPATLGMIGETHLTEHMVTAMHAAPATVLYKKVEGTADGLPFVLEVAFAQQQVEHAARRTVVVGLNWSPVRGLPFDVVYNDFNDARVDSSDPVMVVMHLACPRIEFTDRGKMRAVLPPDIQAALSKAIRAVTKEWTEAKRRTDRDNRVSERELKEMQRQKKARYLNYKQAAFQVMKQAYLKAKGGGTLPANGRQIYYAARPDILRLTGKASLDSQYFTQTLLPSFVEEYPELTADWDVVFDARGHLAEPHTGHHVDLGGLGVRRYMQQWVHSFSEDVESLTVNQDCPTHGPTNRYRFALFIEKEGFDQILAAARIAERYDIAIMSTKGMSTTAARQLVDRLSIAGVTILVAHDFDKSGFSIVHTLRTDSRRYTFTVPPRVIDIGLRLADVRKLNLASEAVEYEGKSDPRITLLERGATQEECNFLVRGRDYQTWNYIGERVELNAMDSVQFIAWLESKLQESGVEKVVPDEAVLQQAYRRAYRRVQVQEAIDRTIKALETEAPDIPPDLLVQIQTTIEGTATSWDEAIWHLATEQRAQRP